MTLHTTTGRWRLGFALSLLTALQWGILPIALKGVLDGMDAFTITWYRFLTAAIILTVYVLWKHGWPNFIRLKNSVYILLFIASLALCGNYILYLLGLDRISPSAATVVIHLAPIFLLLGSLAVFKERFNKRQWVGFAILMIGLFFFFNEKLNVLFRDLSDYTTGVLFVFIAAIMWAIYALAQKQLLETFSSDIILSFIYISGTLMFLPEADLAQLIDLNSLQLFLLLFCGLNAVLAYWCFAEALNHWEASRVSAVLEITPLLTVIAMKICDTLFPGFIDPEHLNNLSIIGVFLVMGGSMICSLSER